MALTFPASPSVGQQTTQNGRVYVWTGTSWDFVGSVVSHKATHATGGSDALTPADIGAISQTAADARYLQLTGGTVTGRTVVDGNVQIGYTSLTNSLIYLDVANSGVGTGSGAITRLITQNVAGTGNTSVDMVKYKNGTFVIANNETDAAASTMLSVSAKEVMRLTSSAYVGIGTSGPVAKLHVISSTAGVTPAQFTGPTGSGVYVDYGGTAQNLYDADGHIFRTKNGTATRMVIDPYRTYVMGNNEPYAFGVRYTNAGGTVYFGATNATATPDVQISNSGGASLMTLQNGGNVGIGTISPLAKLDVRRTYSYALFCDSLYQTAAFGPREANDGYCTTTHGWTTVGTGNYWQQDFSSGLWSVSRVAASVNSGSLLALTSAGNVGIGTNAPAAKLDVRGSAAVEGRVYTTSATSTATLSVLSGTGVGSFQQLGTASYLTNYTTGGNFNFQTTGAGDMVFSTNGVERMRITGTGAITGIDKFYTIGNTGNAYTINLTNGNIQYGVNNSTPGGGFISPTVTFTMPTPTAGLRFTLILSHVGTYGSNNAIFTMPALVPGSVKFPSGGYTPSNRGTSTATPAPTDVLKFIADGTNWYGRFDKYA